MTEPARSSERGYGYWTAVSLVISNVIGVGILTTSGFMARDLGNVPVIIGAWVLGGVLSFCGAVSYAELGAAYPRAGGEYVYLREAFGPAVGFLSGWTSVFVGFAGPVAAAAIGFSAYLSAFFPDLSPADNVPHWMSSGRWLAISVIWAVSAAHTIGLRASSGVQTGITALKVIGLLVFVWLGFSIGRGDTANLSVSTQPISLSMSPVLAVSLIFVMYSYSGWNASVYVAGEIRNPSRNIPLSVITGTLVVTALFVAINVLYFFAIPVDFFHGRAGNDMELIKIGEVAAGRLFGDRGSGAVAVFFAVSILACMSAMVVVGPRVSYAMARDGCFLRAFESIDPRTGTPARAIFFQALLATVYILTGTFEQIITYCGFILFIFAALAVAALFVLRRRDADRHRPYRALGYPVIPLVFVLFCAWVAVFTLIDRPRESGLALLTVAAGLPVYALGALFGRGRAT